MDNNIIDFLLEKIGNLINENKELKKEIQRLNYINKDAQYVIQELKKNIIKFKSRKKWQKEVENQKG